MRSLYKLPLRLRWRFREGRVEKELTEELRFHLEKLIEERVANDMTSEEARYAALREVGRVERIKEDCRDMRRLNHIESLLQDVRSVYARYGGVPSSLAWRCSRRAWHRREPAPCSAACWDLAP